MRKKLTILNLILLINICANCQTKNLKPKEIIKPEFGNILDSLKVKGSILIYDVKNKTYYSNDLNWAKTGIIPASTFKIPNSIIFEAKNGKEAVEITHKNNPDLIFMDLQIAT